MADGEQTELERLDAAVFAAVKRLAAVLGTQVSESDGAPREPFAGSPIVDPEQVPAMPLGLARTALDILVITSGILDAAVNDPGAASPMTVEEGLAIEDGLRRLGTAPRSELEPEAAAALYRWAIGDGSRVPPQDQAELKRAGRALRYLIERAGDELEWVPIEGLDGFGMLAQADEQREDGEGGR